MEREMERFLRHVAGAKPHPCYLHTTAWEPPVNVYLTTKAVVVIAELAGADKETLEVSVEDDLLIIRGCRDEPQLPDLVNHYQVEMHFGKLERRVPLPRSVRAEATTASFQQGLLQVTVPLAQPRTLKVETESEVK